MLRATVKADGFNLGIVLEASYLLEDDSLSSIVHRVFNQVRGELLVVDNDKLPKEFSLHMEITVQSDNTIIL